MAKKRIKRGISVLAVLAVILVYAAGWMTGNKAAIAEVESAEVAAEIANETEFFSDYQTLENDKDFWKMDPLPEGLYQVGPNTRCIVKNGKAHMESINYSSPYLAKGVLVRDRYDNTCLVGVEEFSRNLIIISFKENGTCNEVCYNYADIPDELILERDFKFIDNYWKSSLCRLGTRYSIYAELEEKAYFDIGKDLNFINQSTAVDKFGGLYKISYSNNPWKIEIEQIDKDVHDVEMSFFNWASGASLCSYEKNNKKYIIIPNYEEVFSMERMPGEDEGEKLDEFPEKYSIIEYCPENMEIGFTYGGDSLRFEREEEIKIGETKLTSYTIQQGIKKNYLSIIIPAEELDPYMESIENLNEEKVAQRVEQLKQFLDSWEREHPIEIAEAMKKYDFMLREEGDDWGAREWAETHKDLLK